MLLEVSLFQFYQGGPQFFEVVKFMKDLGFVVYDFFDAHHRLIDGALAQLDVAFVKESGLVPAAPLPRQPSPAAKTEKGPSVAEQVGILERPPAEVTQRGAIDPGEG